MDNPIDLITCLSWKFDYAFQNLALVEALRKAAKRLRNEAHYTWETGR